MSDLNVSIDKIQLIALASFAIIFVAFWFFAGAKLAAILVAAIAVPFEIYCLAAKLRQS